MSVLLNAKRVRGRLSIEPANLAEATKVIIANHYLRRGRTMAQLAYWVVFDGTRCGVLLFALPRLSARTAKFGSHSPMELLELARMWIDPSVQGRVVVSEDGRAHSLPIGSMSVSRALSRIRQDWHGKYPHLPEPRAVVAWSDTTLHEGTVYQASNFRLVGQSGGVGHRNRERPNGGRDQLRPDYLNLKDAYLMEYPSRLSDRQRALAFAEWALDRPRRRNRGQTVSVLAPVSQAVARFE